MTYENVAVRGTAESIEDSFEAVLDEDQSEFRVVLTSEIEQFLADGGGNVSRRWVGQLERLQVRAHHIRDAANFGGGPEFVHRGLLHAPGFLEGFDGDIEADLISELKAVGNGFCRAEHPQRGSGKIIFLYTEMKRWSGHAHQAYWWRGNSWRPGLLADSHPNLVRRLGGEFVEAERGKQTDDSLGHLIGSLDERKMLGSREVRGGVETKNGRVGLPNFALAYRFEN